MIVDINQIKIENRIRSELGSIEELAKDIEENGLLNPPVITLDNVLIAGERRIEALKHLGRKSVEVTIMEVRDYEHRLRLEISENVNRKEFTMSERVEWGKRLEQVERLKAQERMMNPSQNSDRGGRADDIVASEAGFGSRDTYHKAKFIADNADKETLEAWDKGDISTHKAYVELKAKLEQSEERIRGLQKSLEDELTKPLPSPKVIEIEKIPQEAMDLMAEREKALKEHQEQLRELEGELVKLIAQRGDVAQLEAEKRQMEQELGTLMAEIRRATAGKEHEAQQAQVVQAITGPIGHLLKDKGKIEQMIKLGIALDDRSKRSIMSYVDFLRDLANLLADYANREAVEYVDYVEAD